MLLANIVNCLREDGRLLFATYFERMQDCRESLPNLDSAHQLVVIARQNVCVCVCV